MITTLIVSLLALSTPSVAEEKDPLALNKKVVQFVEANMGKKVYEGECVDLPLEALKAAGAKWKFANESTFGRELNTRREDIEPGDIIQFDGAEFENKETKDGWKFPNNSIIVVSIIDRKQEKFKFAVQNLFSKPFVTTHELEMKTLRRGYLKIFRPIPETAPAGATEGADAKKD